MTIASALRAAGFGGLLQMEVPLGPFTTWRIGGPAELLATPQDADDIKVAIAWANRAGLPWRVLGNGSNLLVRDEGVRGLVLRVRRVLDTVTVEGTRIVAGAGVSFPALARVAARAGLAGLEFGGGIPGTLGGAIVMNAGWHQFEIGRAIETVDYLDEHGAPARHVSNVETFGYRSSPFRTRGVVVLAATLQLTAADPQQLKLTMERFAASRKENQPTELASCGSVFLKPEGDFAGRLIEAAGMKGERCGAIEVSHKHANFFVNTGGGTARDVLKLVERVERRVEERQGVRLVREFELW